MNNYICEKRNNEELNGVELFFTVYPLAGTRETLKKHGFRWNHKKSCWYAKRGAMADEIATICAETTRTEYEDIAKRTGETVADVKTKADKTDKPKTAKKPTANKYGVKVGDFFSMSWGYEQTNITHFQVVELVGSASVRIKEVYPDILGSDAQSGMIEYRTYSYDRSKIAPINPHSVFINDKENGDIKRIGDYGNGKAIKIKDHYADLVTTDTAREYVSWYA